MKMILSLYLKRPHHVIPGLSLLVQDTLPLSLLLYETQCRHVVFEQTAEPKIKPPGVDRQWLPTFNDAVLVPASVELDPVDVIPALSLT